MGQLRDRMEQDLKLRGLSPATRRNYLLYCRQFAAFFMRSPEELGAAEVRTFLLHEIEVEQLAYASYRQVYAALKFLYGVTLGRPEVVSYIPFPKCAPRRLPKVLTIAELSAFFTALRKPKYRALFMTCYAAGLRLGEVCRLRVADVDSSRMVIHVRTAKGGKERLTVLSRRLLDEVEPAHAERPGQHGAEPAELVAKKVLHPAHAVRSCAAHHFADLDHMTGRTLRRRRSFLTIETTASRRTSVPRDPRSW